LISAPDYTLRREDLIFRSGESTERGRGVIGEDKRRVIGRSVNIREVDTGSCNACEVEVNSLSNVFYDVERFGIKTVASPRHADVLLVTGPLTDNMLEAFGRVLKATPDPKVIIAMGTCAISGGPFSGGETSGGIGGSADADVFIPGCPPAPDAVIRALLDAFGLH
jgi:Ni,Fe-hydrogenase III small subunit